MRTNPIEILVLEPEEGHTLTNVETYSKRVYLGRNDSPKNWLEVPDETVPEEFRVQKPHYKIKMEG